MREGGGKRNVMKELNSCKLGVYIPGKLSYQDRNRIRKP